MATPYRQVVLTIFALRFQSGKNIYFLLPGKSLDAAVYFTTNFPSQYGVPIFVNPYDMILAVSWDV